MVEESVKRGLCFGLTSGIITTLGLIVGLHSGTGSKKVVLGGIITIAIADALSDSLGIHISEESNRKSSQKKVWAATISTFASKFFFALTFIIPVLLFELNQAIIISIIYGLTLLSILSFHIAREQKSNPWKVITEHLFIAILVIVITHYVGDIVRLVLG